MQKYSGYGKFVSVNIIAAALISLRYFNFLPELPDTLIGWIFMVTATYSQMALLGIAAAIVLLPALWLRNSWRHLILSAAATLVIGLLVVDTIVFSQYRFHINSVVLELLMAGQVVDFPLAMWLMLAVAVALLWVVEYALLRVLESKEPLRRLKSTRWMAAAALAALLATNGIHVWAAAHAFQPVTQLKRYLPLFYPATSNSTMRKYGWVNEQALEQQKLLTEHKQRSDLRYPVHPLQTGPVEKPVNIVILAIDSWRAHTFNAENTPNLWSFAQSGMVLNQHMSTGNATRVGIFGMFYSLPGSYWHSVLNNRASPVLLDRLQALDYQLGIFASAQLNNPEFDQTVFSKVKPLRTGSQGATAVDRDTNITEEWVQWFKQREKGRPSFSFLFYDAPHSYESPKQYAHRYEPMLENPDYLQRGPKTDTLPWLNMYKTSVHFVDSLAKQVIDQLKASGEMDNTIVIITGDHAEEINDNGLNYWGHNSNFSDAQVHVPFAMVGGGIRPAHDWGSAFTSHADVVPTLMKQYLQVENDPGDYAIGVNLLDKPVDRPWLLISGYSQYAVVTANDILEVGSLGQYQLVDKHYKPLKTSPNFAYVQQAMEQMRRFSQ
ncbi:DUF3413 domain-containing protein [Comamonas sp. GB3 AK4-5]|uniref:DUF3413 domain-containing protein n=1 Tax=Comamonas sp. GB3 AK4-5 TaxID=3231487 RepID=UPI00351F0FD1